jgi:hypothetical protein
LPELSFAHFVGSLTGRALGYAKVRRAGKV